METFENSFIEDHFVGMIEVKGYEFIMHLTKSICNIGPLSGCICYYCYLTDSNPNHNLLVEITRKAFLPDEFETEKERMTVMEPLIRNALVKNAERAYRLLNSYDSTIIG